MKDHGRYTIADQSRGVLRGARCEGCSSERGDLNTSAKGDDFLTYLATLIISTLFFKHLYWSIIALQWCVSFRFTTK